MTKLVTSGLILKVLPVENQSKLHLKKGESIGNYLVKEIFTDQNEKRVYLCQCLECKTETYMRMNHKCKVTGCRSCTALRGNMRLTYKIGQRFNTYTVIDVIRGENGVPYYKIKCDCGYEGTRRNLTRIGKCVKCLTSLSPQNRIGKRFGKLIYTEYLGKSKYNAICDCGNKCTVQRDTQSCGCLKADNVRKNAEHWIGYVHGSLKIIGIHKIEKGKRTLYELTCKCGNKIVRGINDLWGIKSCGCQINRDLKTGGKSWNAKLTDKEALALRELYLSGNYNQQQLREMFQINQQHLWKILRNKSYKT
jgi:hypothetical protein